ncbi:hypothetical protein BDV96DRAFT_642696 [Lophiotrema nucula]|uniref:Apple domain-containing protein n=1 Tax=Lophiotrema nucula TaxID=690887 RepID=A0A6A5ZLE8_9PLEO|nr:hypothetical protein BDV96DRAFT_642696 [Lophiotrema nucula]
MSSCLPATPCIVNGTNSTMGFEMNFTPVLTIAGQAYTCNLNTSSTESSNACPTVTTTVTSTYANGTVCPAPATTTFTDYVWSTYTQTVTAGNGQSTSTSMSTDQSCPDIHGSSITTTNGTFVVECYLDRQDSDMGPVSADNFTDCVQTCADTPGCVDVSYIPNGPCYLKKDQEYPTSNAEVWGARLDPTGRRDVNASTNTGASVHTAREIDIVDRRGTDEVAARTINTAFNLEDDSVATCPDANGTTFTAPSGATYAVECYWDRHDSDLGVQKTSTLNTCIELCDADEACVDVSWVPGTAGNTGYCYPKSAQNDYTVNANVWGAREVTTGSTRARRNRRSSV